MQPGMAEQNVGYYRPDGTRRKPRVYTTLDTTKPEADARFPLEFCIWIQHYCAAFTEAAHDHVT